jgi:hypothetical protein
MLRQGVLEPVMLFEFRDHRHAAAGRSLLHQTPAQVLALQLEVQPEEWKGAGGALGEIV